MCVKLSVIVASSGWSGQKKKRKDKEQVHVWLFQISSRVTLFRQANWASQLPMIGPRMDPGAARVVALRRARAREEP